MSDAEKVVHMIICVPVKGQENFPASAPYSVYEKVDCPICHEPMWLGTRSKALAEAGVPMLCLICMTFLKANPGNSGNPPGKTVQSREGKLMATFVIYPTHKTKCPTCEQRPDLLCLAANDVQELIDAPMFYICWTCKKAFQAGHGEVPRGD